MHTDEHAIECGYVTFAVALAVRWLAEVVPQVEGER